MQSIISRHRIFVEHTNPVSQTIESATFARSSAGAETLLSRSLICDIAESYAGMFLEARKPVCRIKQQQLKMHPKCHFAKREQYPPEGLFSRYYFSDAIYHSLKVQKRCFGSSGLRVGSFGSRRYVMFDVIFGTFIEIFAGQALAGSPFDSMKS